MSGTQEQVPERPAVPEADLPILDEQERLLVFASFGPEDAWAVGSALRSLLLERGAGGSVEIELAGVVLFRCVTAGASPSQVNWIRRKRNTVQHFARSTYAIGRKLESEDSTLGERHALLEVDYAAHGGGFPIQLRGTGMVGSVVLSGLPQRDDHNLVVEALAAHLGVEVPRLL